MPAVLPIVRSTIRECGVRAQNPLRTVSGAQIGQDCAHGLFLGSSKRQAWRARDGRSFQIQRSSRHTALWITLRSCFGYREFPTT